MGNRGQLHSHFDRSFSDNSKNMAFVTRLQSGYWVAKGIHAPFAAAVSTLALEHPRSGKPTLGTRHYTFILDELDVERAKAKCETCEFHCRFDGVNNETSRNSASLNPFCEVREEDDIKVRAV